MSLNGQITVSAVDAGRDAGSRRDAERRDSRAGAGEQRVDVPVVAAGELQHPIAPGRAAGEADRAHRRFGARRDEPHHLDRRNGGRELVGEQDLPFGRRAERRAVLGCPLHRVDDLRIGVAEEERPPGKDPVDVAVAVDVDRSYAPSPRATNTGASRPTARIARTGELTPPGSADARSGRDRRCVCPTTVCHERSHAATSFAQ